MIIAEQKPFDEIKGLIAEAATGVTQRIQALGPSPLRRLRSARSGDGP